MTLGHIFAASLKYHRERAGMSQEELASAAALDRTFISQLERGLKSPTLTSLDKLANCLSIDPHRLLRALRQVEAPQVSGDYLMRESHTITITRGDKEVSLPSSRLALAINATHDYIDDMYATDLDIATILGMRNLSGFIGELLKSAIIKNSDGQFRANPHQDGYPDLLLMDAVGKKAWKNLGGRHSEKAPFSPFPSGGIEIKATCGSVPTPAVCSKRGFKKPGIGDARISCLTGYDWKSHHRETNNLIGILWDFIAQRPRIVAMFYSSDLVEEDWREIVQPKVDGGRATSVSTMGRSGIKKMYAGWLCVLAKGEYADYLNRRNKDTLIAVSKA